MNPAGKHPVTHLTTAAILLSACGVAGAQAATLSWNVNSGNWSTSTSWNPNDANPSGDDISITRTGATSSTMDFASGLSVNSLTVNQTTAASGTHTLDLDGNTLTVATNFRVGYGGSLTSAINVGNGTLQIGSQATPGLMQVGYKNASSNPSPTGTFTQTSGSFTAYLSELTVGRQTGGGTATGTVTLSAVANGTLHVQTVTLGLPDYQSTANGTVTLGTGWTLNIGSQAQLGTLQVASFLTDRGTSSGSFTTGANTQGTIYVTDFLVGVSGSRGQTSTRNGTFTLNGSIAGTATNFQVGYGRSATGTASLPGGTFTVTTALIGDNETSSFAGGTGQLNLNQTNFQIAQTGTITVDVSGEVNSTIGTSSAGLNILNSAANALVVTTNSKVTSNRGIEITFESNPTNLTWQASAVTANTIFYGLKWAGNHVNDLKALLGADLTNGTGTDDRLRWYDSALTGQFAGKVGIFYDGTGAGTLNTNATYVGFYASIPEPASLGLLVLGGLLMLPHRSKKG